MRPQSVESMFRLIVLATGSKGNGYILTNGEDTLLIEAGARYKEMLAGLDYKIETVNGMIVSHEHKDHSKYIEQYLKKGLLVHMPRSMKNNLDLSHVYNAISVDIGVTYELGNFTIKAFELVHSVDCLGYYIYHKDLGKMLFITDTEYVKYRFNKLGINHIVVEANYSKELLNRGKVNSNHVLKGHMEINTTTNFLKENDTSSLKNVVLVHLSDSNSDEELFSKLTTKVVHEGVRVIIASAGLSIPLD